MDRARTLLLAGAAGTIAFALAFAYPAYDEVRVLWYYPLERRWAFEVSPTALAIDWYGRCVLATAAGLVGAATGLGIARALRHRLRDAAFPMITAWALTATLLVMGFYAWTLAWREPRPELLPPGYQAR